MRLLLILQESELPKELQGAHTDLHESILSLLTHLQL